MIEVTCIEKLREKNTICGYIIADKHNNVEYVTHEQLRNAIMNKQIRVTNLKLTSNNRLVDYGGNSGKPLFRGCKYKILTYDSKRKASAREVFRELEPEMKSLKSEYIRANTVYDVRDDGMYITANYKELNNCKINLEYSGLYHMAKNLMILKDIIRQLDELSSLIDKIMQQEERLDIAFVFSVDQEACADVSVGISGAGRNNRDLKLRNSKTVDMKRLLTEYMKVNRIKI